MAQEATTHRWELAFDMKTFFHWIIIAIAFVSLSKEVFACWFYVRLKVFSVLSLHPDMLVESLGWLSPSSSEREGSYLLCYLSSFQHPVPVPKHISQESLSGDSVSLWYVRAVASEGEEFFLQNRNVEIYHLIGFG